LQLPLEFLVLFQVFPQDLLVSLNLHLLLRELVLFLLEFALQFLDELGHDLLLLPELLDDAVVLLVVCALVGNPVLNEEVL